MNVADFVTDGAREPLCLDLESVESWTGKHRDEGREIPVEGPVKSFLPSDVLFGRLRPYLAKVACPDRPGVCVGEFFVLRPRTGGVRPEYLAYWLRSKPTVDLISSSTFGAKMPRAKWHFIGGMKMPAPEPEEQDRIVTFLNGLDRVVAESVDGATHMLRLVMEKRRTVVAGAVTRGLDASVQVRPSGVDWLGDVPAHWPVQRVKTVVEVRNGATPKTSVTSYWDGNVCWITPDDLGTLRGREIRRGKRSITEAGYAACGSTMGPAGSVVLSTRAPIGHAGILAEAACTNQGCRLLVPHGIRSEYLYYLICVLRRELASLGRGSTFTELSSSALGSVRVPVPPDSEQKAIVRWIEEATADLNAAVAGVRREIELLQEYRTTLISDVVTGKMDVREAAERLPGAGGGDG